MVHPHTQKSTKGKAKGSVNTIKKLATVQRTGALAGTGGLRTSPTNALDAHATLLLMELRVKKLCFNAMTRLATLPSQHPLHAIVKAVDKY